MSLSFLQTVYTMERLRDITNQSPETKHEQLFQDTYGKLIDDALNKLKDPSDPTHPNTSWQMFKQVGAPFSKMLRSIKLDLVVLQGYRQLGLLWPYFDPN